MALILKDRVQETSTTTGTGTLTLAGAVTQFQTFSSAVGNGNTTYYTIYNAGGTQWEVGVGTVGAGTLSRDTVLASSNANALVSFTGTLYVFGDYPAAKASYLDVNGNVNANAFLNTLQTIAATGGTTTLTVSSPLDYLVTGSGGQTIKLPDATTLVNGTAYTFNNNQSSGAITVNNNSNTLIASIPSGGYVSVTLLSNATSTGSWDRHDQSPSNVSWSTNTLDYSGSITSATWNGNNIALNRGGTNASLTASAGSVPYSTASALALSAVGTAGQVLTSQGTSAPTWTTPTTGTVTAVSATAPVTSSGGATPNIAMPAATTSVSGYLTSTDWTTFNNKGSGTVTSITSTTLTVGGTTAIPTVNLTSGIATAGTTGSATLIPVVTIDTYGRVTSITTAANPQGTVTSVAATVPAFLSISGSPITSTGTLAISYSGTALPVANGGTNATSASITAFNNITGYTASGATGTTSTNLMFSTNPSITNPTVTNYVETLYAPSAGSSFTISLANGTVQEISLNANGTITLPSSVAGKSFVIIVTYSGAYTLTWAGGSTIKWPGGTAPTASSASGKYDIFTFFQDGTNTYGNSFGLNY